jgi:hypothetical protein
LDFNDTSEENSFRLEVRDWLKNNANQDKKSAGYVLDEEVGALARAREWQAKKSRSWLCGNNLA